MRNVSKFVVVLTVGIGLGFAASSAMRAEQTKVAPGYVIAEVNVTDREAFKSYPPQVVGTFAPFGGKYLVRAGKITPIEGAAPTGYFLVIAFDSVQKAVDWENSPAYEAIKPIRQKSAKSRVFIVEGVTPQ